MKTLHRYLLRQVIASLVMTVIVFTLVLLIGSVLRDLLRLVVSEGATLGLFARAMGLLIPFVGAFSLPIGMLTATLLVFGRFSADQELTAARASGVSLLSLVAPILVLSLVLCAVSAAVNLYVAPRSRVAYKNLKFELQAAVLSKIQLPEGRPIEDFPGYIIYIGRNRNDQLKNVLIYRLKNTTNLVWTVQAPRGRLEVNTRKKQIVLHLSNATYIDVAHEFASVTRNSKWEIPLPNSKRAAGATDISDMTFTQLRHQLHTLERRINLPPARGKLSAQQQARKQRELASLRRKMTGDVLVQIHQKVAFSFACFAFTLVGIPLGIRVHRRETNIGVALALLLVAVYYALIIVANTQANHPEWHPELLMWLPNLLFETVGVILLWRANRGGA